jgi:site-specific recombinase XerD
MAVRKIIRSEVSPQGSASVEIVCAHCSPRIPAAGSVESPAMRSGPNHPPPPPWPLPVRSFARANQELAEAFDRFLQARGFAESSRISYGKTLRELIEGLGAKSVAEVDRVGVRELLGRMYRRGLDPLTLRRHTAALRSFFKFLQISRLSRHDPTAMIGHRKLPTRVQRVLTIAEIDRLIDATKTPLETAAIEWLYSTGIRVSEFCNFRLEDLNFADRTARVKNGKNRKDRVVLWGRKADAAIRKMLEQRPSQAGYLFETRAQNGSVSKVGNYWYGRFYDDSAVEQYVPIGTAPAIPTRAHARQALDRVLAEKGYKGRPARPFTDRAIRLLVSRVARRAGLGRVYPHALRRAFCTHLLEGGADLRVIQELAGHARITTTALYCGLSSARLKDVHTKCHPTAGGRDAKS